RSSPRRRGPSLSAGKFSLGPRLRGDERGRERALSINAVSMLQWRSPPGPDTRPATKDKARMRKSTVKRTTKETDVEVEVDLDGASSSSTPNGIGFLDHMLDLLARHSRIDITVKAKGDLHIDHHYTTEDVGIALGQAVKQALGDMRGITRYADVHVPM